jgi:hypothetical protein
VPNGLIDLHSEVLEPLSFRTIKLNIQPTAAGVFCFEPKTSYIDGFGEGKIAKSKPLKIRVLSGPIEACVEKTGETQKDIKFESEAAEKIFGYLLKAFKEDYSRLKLPHERSGWRSLMEIVRETKVSRYSVYGFPSSQGQAIAELQHAQLIEVRVFAGERGRGGKILKARIAADSNAAKSRLNQ